MRYLGGKRKMLPHIIDAVNECCAGAKNVIDLFAGTGVVSTAFKRLGLQVTSNDNLYFSYCLLRGGVIPNHAPREIEQRLQWLNSLDTPSRDKHFIEMNYSDAGAANRMFFQSHNARRIDAIRQAIELWRDTGEIDETTYYYLLAALLHAVPYVSNITGTYAAYLKYWDNRALRRLTLEPIELIDNGKDNMALNLDYEEALTRETDVLYADPPYNSRDYLSNYHLLETIARYDSPAITGVAGTRQRDVNRSEFCSKRTVESAFEKLISNCRARHVIISYNNEAILSSERLAEMCADYAGAGTFRLREFDYRRYKNKIPNNNVGLREQLFIFEKR